MKYRRHKIAMVGVLAAVLLLSLAVFQPAAAASSVFEEDFETDGSGVRYTASEECTDLFYDYFVRTDGSNIGTDSVYNSPNNTWFWAAMDTDGTPECNNPVQTITWTNIDISSYTELVFSGLFAEDDSNDTNEDWDDFDYVWVEVNIDGGGYQKILAFENDGTQYNTVPQQDTDFDGNGDGTALTATFAEFTANLPGTGTSMDLRITTHLDAGDEDVAFDLLKVDGSLPPAFMEDFETDGSGVRYTASEECTDLFYDYFVRTDGSNIGTDSVYNSPNNTWFWAAMDTDGTPDCNNPVQTITWTNIDISSYTELVFSGLFAEDDSNDTNEDWDDFDYVWVEVNIDGGGYQKILAFENDGTQYNTVPQQDTDFDGNGDGAALTDTFVEFTAPLPSPGTSMDLRITTHLDAGDEDVAFDLLMIAEPPDTPLTDLTITKVDLADPVVISTTLTYTVTVSNDSLVDAEGVSMTDTLPVGVVFVSATPDQGTCAEAALVVTCDLLTITAGASVEVVISVDAPASTGIITNDAAVVTTTPESNENNNAASEDTIITGSLDYVTIYEIQYTADPSGDSPYKDVVGVTTEGIVTGVYYNGYFIEDPAGGAWNGLWVFDTTNVPIRGDRVRITGKVAEYYNNTEMEAVTAFTVESSGNPVPGPEVLSTSDANLEQWEGVLVQVQDVVVTNDSLGYGEWAMDDGSGEVQADDKGDYDYIPTNGDELIAVTGPLDYTFGFVKIQPRDNADIVEKVLQINEINADPDTVLGDANGDGVVNSMQDEFVEIVNISSEPLDISGWTLSDFYGLRHTFPAGTIIQARCAIVVFGGGTPTGDFGNVVVQTASEGALGLNNSGDTVTISDGTYAQAAVIYGSEGGDNQSLTRDPDVIGDFVLHSIATGSGGALFSPGTKIDGSRHIGCNTGEFGMCGDSALSIHDVQGDGLISPISGMPSVVIEAVVVGDFQGPDELRGFYVQEEDSDADANMATSEGVFVYEYTATLDVNIGDVVRLQGTVDEYFEVTQIKNLTSITVCTGISDTVASAAVLDLPVVDYEDFESYEGMKISIPETLWVSQNYFQGRYGQVTLSSDGRLYQPTQIYSPDSTEMWDLVDENQRRMIVLDDGTTSENPYPIPYIGTDNTLRAGDTTDNLIGVMDYGPITSDTSFRHYRIQPLSAVSFTRVNNRVQEPVKDDGVLRVASFNVLNLFNGDGLGGGFPTSRGADTLEEYNRQLTKIVDAMDKINAEIFGLMEIENDATPYSAIEDLVAALNAVSTGTYDFIDTGVIGTDEIKVALIYKTEVVTPVGAFAILDSTVDPTFLDTKNRPVLAQTFMDNSTGKTFTVAVNHLKSKGSACDDVGDPNLNDGQGNCNLTRTSAAIAEANWLATNPTGYGDGDYLIIGDLNAYAEEDPVTSLLDLGYANLQDSYIGPYAYSYIFDGGSGTLDHALATSTMSWQVLAVSIWHINTDEPSVIDYNVEFKSEDLYSPDPFRSSDHDPVLIDLSMDVEIYVFYWPLMFK